jgi:hypothetical protein
MKTELHKVQNSIAELNGLSEYAYERIFRVYKDQDRFFAYNILKTVRIPYNLDKDSFYYYRITDNTTWAGLSYKHYGSIGLWWLICLASGISNPVQLPESGMIIRIIKPSYARTVIDIISKNIS